MKVVVTELVKQYKGKQVLKGLNFELNGPAIVGFLGHNGAGKTTFLNILAGLVAPSHGGIKVNGQDAFDNRQVMEDICFIAETGNFQEHMTIAQVLKGNQYFYPNWNQELAEQLVTQFSLNSKDKVKSLSKGMASALGIITGLASQASITIFDEPYIGLDAAGRNLFYDLLIEQYTEHPRLIILSTHLIDEASNLFDEVVILQDGELIVQKPYHELQETVITVKGKRDEVDRYAEGHHIIYENSFLNEKSVVMMRSPEHNLISPAVKVESVKLQELMILLSKNGKKELYQ